MSFWETITGSDLTREWKEFEARAQVLPAEYRAAWEQMKGQLFLHGDFTGRSLMPIFDSALGLLEQASADGQSIQEVFGDDIPGFCTALAGGAGAGTYRDRWREQLNNNVARKLGRLGG
ncbi:DUF1048 domain-containing protein [Actinoplanes regularis]|uniref:DNA-binding ferritin-like protein (Dps family) n=1 Tax=Actinoplanes regularis TaxID=52697 RepID=A0A239JLA8_9ACTN|nr:DUF1048 domain-containing protein [Actinoplanes regularis]GIE92045.1 hypothetical protein Are01nite_85250 [Actinoplanes regularis]SNT06093.1 DNA-binding ferritin-like protein (Dps family) [Actinoplanes regularis]